MDSNSPTNSPLQKEKQPVDIPIDESARNAPPIPKKKVSINTQSNAGPLIDERGLEISSIDGPQPLSDIDVEYALRSHKIWSDLSGWELLFGDYAEQFNSFMEQRPTLSPLEAIELTSPQIGSYLDSKRVTDLEVIARIKSRIKILQKLQTTQDLEIKLQATRATQYEPPSILDRSVNKTRSSEDLPKGLKLYNWDSSKSIMSNLVAIDMHIKGKAIPVESVFPFLRASVKVQSHLEAMIQHQDELMNKPWEEIKMRVREILEPGKTTLEYEDELYNLKKERNTVRVFMERFQKYTRFLSLSHERQISILMHHLKNTKYELAVQMATYYQGDFKNVDDLIKFVYHIAKTPDTEVLASGTLATSHKEAPVESPNKKRKRQDDRLKENDKKRHKLSDEKCKWCKKQGHQEEKCWLNPNNPHNRIAEFKRNEDSRRPTDTNKKGAAARTKRVGAEGYNSGDEKEPPSAKAKAKAVKVKQLKLAEEQFSSKQSAKEAYAALVKHLATGGDPIKDSRKATIQGGSDPITIGVEINGTPIQAELDNGASHCMITTKTLNKIDASTYILSDIPLSVSLAEGPPKQHRQVLLTIDCLGIEREMVFGILHNKDNDCVLLGRSFISDWGLACPLPDVEEEPSLIFRQNHTLATLDRILESQELIDRGAVVYHPNAEQYGQLIRASVESNLATADKLSTIGYISIDFIDEKDRNEGSWESQYLMAGKLQEQYEQQTSEWVQVGIAEEIFDHLDENIPVNSPMEDRRTRKRRFNTKAFNIYSGKPRTVHNFVHINGKIKSDTNFVPGIDELFKTVSRIKPKIYSKIDLRSAYLQVPLRPEDRHVTAFMCGNKRYQFITAPLGLKHIPSIFQRLIKSLLQYNNCSVHLQSH